MRVDRRLALFFALFVALAASCGDPGDGGPDAQGGSDQLGGAAGSMQAGGAPGECEVADELTVSWQRLSAAIEGVTPRSRPTLAETDSAIVLFGGEHAGTALADTWTFQPGEHTFALGPLGPSSRAGHAMVGTGASALLFGGVVEHGNSDETWSLADGWDTPCASGDCTEQPSARAHHAMAFDPTRGLVVLFGGNDLRALGDTWTWDPAGHWHHVCGSNDPGAVAEPQANMGGVGNASTGGTGTDTDTGTGTDTEPEPQAMGGVESAGGAHGAPELPSCGPAARADHSLVYDPVRRSVVLFGGSDGATDFDDVWTFDAEGWQKLEVAESGPSPRSGHSAVVDSATGLMLIVGGAHDGVPVANEVWGLALDTGRWVQAGSPATAPPPRNHAAMIEDRAAHRALLFGGRGTTDLSDLWALSASYTSGEQVCVCQAECQSVCGPMGPGLCAKRCEGGLQHPRATDCLPTSGGGGTSGFGGTAGVAGSGGNAGQGMAGLGADGPGGADGGPGGAGGGPQLPNCQALSECCSLLADDERTSCTQAAFADDSAICDSSFALCSEQTKNPELPSDCLKLAPCCTNLGGNLRNSCVALLNTDNAANCTEFASGGFCRSP